MLQLQSFDTTSNTTASDREIETNGCECCPHCGPRKQLCDFGCDVGSLLLDGFISYLLLSWLSTKYIESLIFYATVQHVNSKVYALKTRASMR